MSGVLKKIGQKWYIVWGTTMFSPNNMIQQVSLQLHPDDVSNIENNNIYSEDDLVEFDTTSIDGIGYAKIK
jgi:hypothetical protein